MASKNTNDYYNRFDAIVVFFSLIEIILEVANAGGGGGLSALRAFRIFRVFKMAKDWGAAAVASCDDA